MKTIQRCIKSPVIVATLLALASGTVLAAAPMPAQSDAIEQARAAALAAQKAAVAALKAAEDAIAANDAAARQAAVQRALDAAAEANEAASKAQLAIAAIQRTTADAAPPVVAATPATPAVPAKGDDAATSSTPLADARVSGVIKAGQADDTASITLTWSEETVKRATFNSITFSAPTTSDGKPTRLGTLDGLADTASVKYSYTRRFPVDPLHPDEKFWSIGAAAKIGRKEYTYIDPVALQESKSSKMPHSASLFAGYVPSDRLMLLAKVEVQRKYKENDEKIFCKTNATGEIDCLSGAAGAPPRTNARIFTIGTRYLGQGFSLAPTFNYDRVAGVRGIDLPLYLLGAGDGKPGALSGGVGASWRSDTRNTAFYVFVGSPLSFWATP